MMNIPLARFFSSLLPFLLFIAIISCLPVNGLQAQRSLLDKKESTTCVDREFVVMVHLLRDTFQNINSHPDTVAMAIELANRWFEPICVNFVIGQVDTIDNFQYDEPANFNELEELWTTYNALNRINLYVISSTQFITTEPVYATQEGILINDEGGILITFNAIDDNPLWLVHGIGHYAGLLDTQEGMGTENVNGDNCETVGDEICDTPADPLNPQSAFGGLGLYFNAGCRFIWEELDSNGEFYVPQTGNALSRYPTYCWCGLTFEQFEKMADLMSRSPLW